MNWREIIEESKNEIDNFTQKEKVAKKIVEKVKDGQVIRIWFWLNIILSSN